MSLFEWDPGKAEKNRLKHGITFDDAAIALMGVCLLAPRREDVKTVCRPTASLKGV